MKASKILAYALIASFSLGTAANAQMKSNHHMSHKELKKEHKKWEKEQKKKEKKEKKHHHNK